MKKTFQISLAKSLFTIEEDAFTTLEEYLNSVKKHFRNTEGKEEIIQDIEARIAEQFIDAHVSIITASEVDKVIHSMGSVDEFGDDDGKEEPVSKLSRKRKLYRNPDDSVVGGVCSGLAAYFGIETLIVRLIFVALLFANGIGLMVYIILLIAMPAAKTASQKLEMRGSDVTLESLSETERRTSGKDTMIVNFFIALMPVIRIGLAGMLILVALGVLAGMLFALPHILMLPVQVQSELPLWEIVSVPHFYGTLAAGYIAVLIPVIVVILLSIGLIRKQNIIKPVIGYWMLAVWVLVSIGAIIGGSTAAASYRNYITTVEREEVVTRNIPLDGEVKNLIIASGQKVKLISGAVPSLVVTGHAGKLQDYTAHIQDGTLAIERGGKPVSCLICAGNPEYILTLPDIASVKVQNNATLYARNWTGDGLDLQLQYKAHADLTVALQHLEINAGYGSSVDIAGTASGVVLKAIDGSGIRAGNLITEHAKVSASQASRVVVNAQNTLDMVAENGGIIRYSGSATPQITTRNGLVEKIDD